MLNQNWYPETYKAVTDPQAPSQEPIFEPALLQYTRAFRLGDPTFEDLELQEKWYAARRQVIGHLLRLSASSLWGERLMLRGSLLLKHWIGAEAREPGDIDWVFRGPEAEVSPEFSEVVIGDLVALVKQAPVTGTATIEVDRISRDNIWAYERVPGRRIQFPWTAPGLPSGQVQMDISFGEPLPEPPQRVQLSGLGGEITELWAASPELSLAWKLGWVLADAYPQGKDLYDATLLAEHTRLPQDLFDWVLRKLGAYGEVELSRFHFNDSYIDWENFQKEYPWVQGDRDFWIGRLLRAVGKEG